MRQDPEITPELVASHGIKPDEYERLLSILGRTPSFTELGIFSAMWNEHCSYKSSKKWLRTLPTEGPQVICGPGENAGVVDIGDGQALAHGDIVAPALASEALWHSMSVTQDTGPALRRLAALAPITLAIMHGSSLNTGCADALRSFADGIVRQSLATAA